MTSRSKLDIRLKRAYEAPSKSDGTRVLIDRLWPRGLTKEKAGVDRWLKDIAPSTQLRRWFGHDPERWGEFQRRYAAELKRHSELVDELVNLSHEGTLTLVFGARDEEHNDAVVLKNLLLHHAGHSSGP